MFDNGIHFVVVAAHDAAIAKGIGDIRSKDRSRIAAVAMKVHEMLQAVAADQAEHRPAKPEDLPKIREALRERSRPRAPSRVAAF